MENSSTSQPLSEQIKNVKASIESLSQILVSVKSCFHDHDFSSARRYKEEIADVLPATEKDKFTVGIVGQTGSGKSATINSLLGRGRIVPTNPVRASTATVTEISYHDSDNQFQAEIQFISQEEWRKELEVLFTNLVDSTGRLYLKSGQKDDPAGAAFTRMKAVYPFLTEKNLPKTSIESLMSDEIVKHLGKVELITSSNPTEFTKDIKRYIDSRDKSDLRSQAMAAAMPEYWPLIHSVRILVKSMVLESGVTLVDLPGVNDSNIARSGIAKKHLRDCSLLLIATPIHRASDDQSAGDLVDASLRRQLQLNDDLGNVVFVCTKIDDIDEKESEIAFCLQDILKPLRLRKAELEDHIRDLQEQRAQLAQLPRVARDVEFDQEPNTTTSSVNMDSLQLLKESPKRKRSDEHIGMVKKMSCLGGPSNETHKKRESKADLAEPQPVFRFGAQEISEENAGSTPRFSISVESYRPRIDRVNARLNDHKEKLDAVKSQIKSICMKARNEKAISDIKTGFANSVRRMDEELAADEDPQDIDPCEERRDYEQIASDVKVFCVSSRAFERLTSVSHDGEQPLGFDSVNDTGIPELCEFLRSLGQERELGCLKDHKNLILKTIGHLRIWSFENPIINVNSKTVWRDHQVNIDSKVAELFAEFLEARDCFMRDFSNAIHSQIILSLGKAAARAEIKVESITFQFFECMRWNTLKALSANSGEWRNSDLNETLTNLMFDHITKPWEEVFVKLVNEEFHNLTNIVWKLTKTFDDNQKQFLLDHGADSALLSYLNWQIFVTEYELSKALGRAQKSIKKGQREIRTQLPRVVADVVADTYRDCASEGGTGMFKRMQSTMANGVYCCKEVMFQALENHLRHELSGLSIDVEEALNKDVEAIIEGTRRDYTKAFRARDDMTEAETNVQGQIRDLLLQNEELIADTGQSTAVQEASRGVGPSTHPPILMTLPSRAATPQGSRASSSRLNTVI